MDVDWATMLQIARKCAEWKSAQMGFPYSDDLQSYVNFNVWSYSKKYVPGVYPFDKYVCHWSVKMTAKFITRERAKRLTVAYDSETLALLSRNDTELIIDEEDKKFINDMLAQGGTCSTGETKKLHLKRLSRITRPD